jgi:small subunit ribosomal protein S16
MRMGKKKQPTYRVVVADGRSPRDGRYIEILGQYRPREEPSYFVVDDEKILGWLAQGAQPTDQVHKLLVGAGIWERYESGRKQQSQAVRTAAAKAKGAAARDAKKAEDAKAAAEAEAKAAKEAEAADAAAAESADDAPAEEPAAEEAAPEASADEAPAAEAATEESASDEGGE